MDTDRSISVLSEFHTASKNINNITLPLRKNYTEKNVSFSENKITNNTFDIKLARILKLVVNINLFNIKEITNLFLLNKT